MKLYGAIEAGGTKFNCLVATDKDNIIAQTRISTICPVQTIPQVFYFFQPYESDICGIGIGTFGPLNLRKNSKTFGLLTHCNKPSWDNYNIYQAFKNKFNIPIAIDTDVNAACLGEYCWGAGQNCSVLVYITIGTGIGGGVIVNGKTLSGLMHTEMGHITIPHDKNIDSFPGCCPRHQNCWQGLASGQAISQRWQKNAETLQPNHPAWPLEANYIAAGICNIIYTLSPQKIILGGGVMDQKHLLPMIHTKVFEKLNGYFPDIQLKNNIESIIITPALKSNAGLMGALALIIKANPKN